MITFFEYCYDSFCVIVNVMMITTSLIVQDAVRAQERIEKKLKHHPRTE